MSDIQVIIPLGVLAEAKSLAPEDIVQLLDKLQSFNEITAKIDMMEVSLNALGEQLFATIECDDQMLKAKSLRNIAKQLTEFKFDL